MVLAGRAYAERTEPMANNKSTVRDRGLASYFFTHLRKGLHKKCSGLSAVAQNRTDPLTSAGAFLVHTM